MPFYGSVPSIVNFVNTSTDEFTDFLWDFGDGTTSTSEDPQHTYTESGDYLVTLTASNELYSQSYSDYVYIGPTNTGYEAPAQAFLNCIGVDPVVMLRTSNDGGKNWSPERMRTAGRMGEYDKRVRWTRLGQGRKRVFEVVVTDPIPWKVTGCYMKVSKDGARFR